MIIKTNFKDLFIFKNKSFKDKRGYFKELVKEKIIKKKFPFTVMSYSKKNVIRGLHIQTKKSQGKFISVLKGRIYDVALDLRKSSKTFGKVFTLLILLGLPHKPETAGNGGLNLGIDLLPSIASIKAVSSPAT